jgi:D-alanine-D-alanine ligase
MENIAIISGGYSGESVVSVESAKFVAQNLNSELYRGFVIVIQKDSWFYDDSKGNRYEIDKNDFSLTLPEGKISFHKVFNIIHGDPGENGKIRAYFEMLNMPVTHSDSLVSALTFHKAHCNQVVKAMGVNIADSVYLLKGEAYQTESILEKVGLPCFVKPNAGGSSIGMTKVKTEEELIPAIERAFREDNEVLIETFIQGREITCGIIQSKETLHVLPLCEVVSKKEYFDFEAKYDPKLADEIIPAPVDQEIETSIKNITQVLYQKLNCQGVVRMDYIVTEDNIYFLEVNTIPGLSGASIVPQMARAYGWSNAELIERILEEAR